MAHDFRLYQITRNVVIHVKPVPKLGNIVPKSLKKKIWLPPVVMKEAGGELRFFFWQHVVTTSGTSVHF